MSLRTSVLLILIAFIITSAGAFAQTRYPPVTPKSWDHQSVQAQNYKKNKRSENTANRFDETYQNQLTDPSYVNTSHTYKYPAYDIDDPSLNKAQEEKSALENMYSERIVDNVEQFGYDLFGVPKQETRVSLRNAADESYSIPSGAVQDNFILDISDQLEIVFTGQRNDRDIYNINSQGMLLIPDFPPIPAAGRTIGQVRISVEAAARNFHNTQAYISLASVRQINVLVVGHVKRPGRQNLTVFHTILDALMETGGIQKTGSLRQIKLIRDGRSQIIDIYSLLLYGATNADLQLRDGDRIIVPPIGPTIAISGEVKRPGIYELQPRFQGMRHKPETTSQNISLNDALELAGGVLVSGQNRFLKLSVTNQGHENVAEVHEPFQEIFGDGSVLIVSKGKEKRAGMVELTGHTRSPGIHALHEVPTLSALLSNSRVLGEDIYPLIGVLERWNPQQLSTSFIDFPLQLVMNGDFDQKLKEDDVVHLFSKKQILELNKNDHTKGGDIQRDQDDLIIEADYQQPAITEQGSNTHSDDPYTANIDDKVMSAFLNERAVFVRGAVRNSGHFPVAHAGVTLDNILAVSGGLALEANTSNIEITSSRQGINNQDGINTGMRRLRVNLRETSPKSIIIGPGDSVRVNQKFDKITDKSVLIMGEVRNPGRYDLIPGDTISALISRA